MGLELIYTSAKKGLKPGSVGFCTVAMSRQMSPTLAATLESLSGYRHLYAAGNGNYADNPVNFCHYLVPERGRVARVIARIGAAPADYTGRTNKLAHFMVLDSAELPLAGPAWLLERRGLMQEMWQGEPRLIESPAVIPSGDSTPAQCAAWQRVTGDAGWAGELLRRFCDQPEAPVHVICKPGTNMLELFAEALALLPTELRWQIAFSTYFTGLPVAGIKCHWRGIIAGTAGVEGTLDPKSILDLTRPMGRAPDGQWNQAARNGTIVDLSAMRSPVITREAPITLAAPQQLPGPKAATAKPADPGVLDLSPLAPERKATRFFRPHNVDQTDTGRHMPRKRRWILPVVLGSAAFVILVAVGAFFVIPIMRSMRQLSHAGLAFGRSLPKNTAAREKSTSRAAVGTAAGTTSNKTGASKHFTRQPQGPLPARHGSLIWHLHGSVWNFAEVRINAAIMAARSEARRKADIEANSRRPRLVRDFSIFATSVAGTLPKATPATVNGITRFRVRPPTPVKTGRLALFLNKSAGGKWGKPIPMAVACRLGRVPRPAALDYVVRWVPNTASSAGIVLVGRKRVTLCHIDIPRQHDVLAVWPARHLRGPGMPYVEQMVVDVQLKNGRKERIQFLSDGDISKHLNSPKVIYLDSHTPATVAIASSFKSSPKIRLVEESLRPSPFSTAAKARKGGQSFLINLGARAVSGKKPRVLIFSVAGGEICNNFKALSNELQVRLDYWKKKVQSTREDIRSDKSEVSREEKSLKADRVPRSKWSQKQPLEEYKRMLKKARKKQHHAKLGKNKVAAQIKRLADLESATFRVELYPGGPVLERFTFKRGGG